MIFLLGFLLPLSRSVFRPAALAALKGAITLVTRATATGHGMLIMHGRNGADWPNESLISSLSLSRQPLAH